ncbi:14 kDa proline-rich protein DC2.15-like [Coffea arabica]|uniref:14 kDa proline-rich protein DC2.15-like n=1 Tax=Coffea arabica TaxID=13443 RepID=A0A6P6SPG8_COFAR|nr:14 kDa proline-rich protein DC2.15-like [Coffea arabica]
MGSKATTNPALFLAFFILVSASVHCAPPPQATCPKDALKLGICANLLSVIGIFGGSPVTRPCCSLIDGLADLGAAVCFCTALKFNVLGIHLNLPLNLAVTLNACDRRAPPGFICV